MSCTPRSSPASSIAWAKPPRYRETFGPTYALMDQSREGRELWRIIQMSTHDHLCDLFENERVRMHFARVAGENLVSPDEKATAIGAYVFLGFLEASGFGVARGGAFAIARHSLLRGASCAAADATSEPSKAKTTGKYRTMARPVFKEVPVLYRAILHPSSRHFSFAAMRVKR